MTQLNQLAALTELELSPEHPARAQVRKSQQAVHAMFRSVDEIVWAVNPQNDNLSSLLSYLREFATGYLESAKIALRFDWPQSTPLVAVSGRIRHQLFLVVKEALHNILRHSGASAVVFTASIDHGLLRLALRDNGAGFDPANVPADSNGLRNMRKRIEDLGGSFTLSSAPQQGTALTAEVNL